MCVCAQCHRPCCGRPPFSSLPRGLILNIYNSGTIHTVSMTSPIQPTYSDTQNIYNSGTIHTVSMTRPIQPTYSDTQNIYNSGTIHTVSMTSPIQPTYSDTQT